MNKKNFGTNITVEAVPFHMPTKAHETDAAYDLYNAKDVEAFPNTRVYIPLGFKISLPTNLCMVIQPRSGQSGKGMIAFACYPKWLRWISRIPARIRINADAIVGLIDSQYGGEVMAIVKFGRFRLKHRILRLLGFKIEIGANSCICQGRFVYVPDANLVEGVVKGTRSGLGSTDEEPYN